MDRFEVDRFSCPFSETTFKVVKGNSVVRMIETELLINVKLMKYPSRIITCIR